MEYKMILCDKIKIETIDMRDKNYDFRNISEPDLKFISEHCQCENLKLYHLKISHLDSLVQLSQLRRLEINWANKIENFNTLQKLDRLSELTLINTPLLNDLSFLEGMAVEKLIITGGTAGKSLKIKTLKPILSLKKLKHLSLYNLKVEDDDITVLSGLITIEELNIANMFETSQFAVLAAALNTQLKEPVKAFYESSIQCEKCGNQQVMITGRRKPFLCPVCDSSRVIQYEKEFEKMKTEAGKC